MGLEHVNITVRDLDESSAFYCTLLGGRISWEGTAVNMTRTVRAAHVELPDRSYISMFERESGERAPYDYAPPGINHIGFVIDDLAEARDRLRQLACAVEKEASYAPGKRIYLFDPNGIEIELVEYEDVA